MQQDKPRTLVDDLVVSLSREIFRGEYLPGEKLAPLRRLAKSFEVTVPTAQRAVARLEEMGLVEAHQGSGVRVLEPRTHVGPSALPYWIDAVSDVPDEARALLEDFLELRRRLAVDALIRLRRAEGPVARERVLKAVDALAERVADPDADRASIARADLAVARAVLRAHPQIAYAAVFNVLERLLLALEPLQRAMYRSPQQSVAGYRAVLALLDSGQSDATIRVLVEAQLQVVDERTVNRFLSILADNQEDA